MPTGTRNDEIPLVIKTRDAMTAAWQRDDVGNGGDRKESMKAVIAYDAACAANKAVHDMTWLRDKLNAAIERVRAAENVQDAYLGMTDLRTSLWGDVQTALAELGVFAKYAAKP